MQDPRGEEASDVPIPETNDQPISTTPGKAPLLSSGRLPSSGSERSSFSLGATPEEILRVQGTPDRIRGQTWIYGLSEISFKDGRIARYNNFGGELRVHMAPNGKPPVPPLQWFTLGTTSDDVLGVQGTPTRVEGSKWYYGFSEIVFKNGRVEGFDNYFGILKVKMLPSASVVEGTPRPHFTVGSSMDDVLAVQGTPSSIRGNVWFYQFSNVLFRNGKVQNAVDTAGVLRFVLPEENTQKK